MPIKRCQSGGKPGFRWGDSGKCFTYTAGDAASRERAKKRAQAQGAAAQASQGKKKKR